MKKLLFAMGIMLATVVLSSCNSEESVVLPEENNVVQPSDDLTALVAFNERLDSLNIARFESNVQTRGWLKRLWDKIVDVFKSDAEGARTAAENGKGVDEIIVSAVVASVCEIFTKEPNGDTTEGGGYISTTTNPQVAVLPSATRMLNVGRTTSTVLTPFPQANIVQYGSTLQVASSRIDSVGYYHNTIITNMFKKNNSLDFWRGLSKEKLLEYVNEETEKELNLPVGTLQARSASTLKMLNEMENKDVYYANLRMRNPKTAQTIDAISNYLYGISNIDNTDDCLEYSNEIVKIIDESDMSVDDKKILYVGVSVAFSSSMLWNPEAIAQ